MINANPKITNLTRQSLFLRKVRCKLINLKTKEFVDVDKLRISFSVKRGSTSTANDGKIEIYNLNEEVRNFTEIAETVDKQVPTDGLFIELYAGYQDVTRQIFTGFASGGSKYESPDWVSTFRVIDGKSPIIEAKFIKSYNAGYPINNVIIDLLKSFKLPIDYIPPVITSDLVKYGLALSGNAKDLLDQYSNKYRFLWSIQNNSILVTFEKLPIPGNIIILTPRSGLLSRPLKTDKGLEFSTLLIPSLRPGILVQIDDDNGFTGTALVNVVDYKGDSHRDKFECFVEARLL